MQQPEFDFSVLPPAPRSTWQEVPQARFLSWSPGRQAGYCALRDEDSARHALSEDWAEFYRARAKDYWASSKESR